MSLTNAPLVKAFDIIKQQTPYRIIYDNSLLKKAVPVTVAVNKEPLPNVLPLLFRGQPFEYRIIDQSIILTPQQSKGGTAHHETGKLTPLAEDTLITGVVMADSSLLPLSGATIQVKETNISTSTDNAGMFRIRIPQQGATLVVSYVEYSTKNVVVKQNAQFPLRVLLIKAPKEIEGVTIVSTGYESLPRERATGSFEKVDNKLFNRSVTTNVLERLDGIVPGLIFNRSLISRGNDESDISIRGISTLYSNMQPLIVVDNFPYSGNISNINPNDVESITILKDAVAASIWGARSGNGVIVITTKKGRFNQKPTIDFNSNITISEKPDLYYIPQFTSSDFIDIEKMLFSNGFYDAELDNTWSYPIISPVVATLADQRSGLLTEAEANSRIERLRSLDIRKDYLKYLYRRSVNQQYALNINGGGENMNYYFSAGYDKNLTTSVGNEFQRVSLKSQINITPVENLNVHVGMLFTQAESKNNSPLATIVPGNGKNVLPPYVQLADAAGNHLATPKIYNSNFLDTVGKENLLDWHYRPLDELNNANNRTQITDYLLNVGIDYQLNSFLSVEAKYQFEKQMTNASDINNLQSFYTRNLINVYTPTDGTASLNSAIPYGGIIDLNNTALISQSGRGQINFNKSFNGNHSINALAGFELRQARTESNRSRTYGYDDGVLSYQNTDFVNLYPTYQGLNGSAPIPNNLYFGYLMDRYISAYGTMSYVYNQRYTLSASARRDASNLFGVETNNKWKPLWSVGGGWQLSNEKFYRSRLVPNLKLRATYGYSGNINNTVTGVLTLNGSQINSLNNLPVYIISNAPNPNLRWETVRMGNIGVDFAFHRNIISGSIEYYQKKSTDLISSIPADPTSGYSYISVNSANLKGNGVDVSILTKNIDRNFKWQTNWLFSYNRNKVTKYLVDYSTASSYAGSIGLLNPKEGQDAYAILSWRWAGLDPQNGDPRGYLDGKVTSNYDSIASFSNYTDLIYSGSARPTCFGSVRNTFSWKAFSISMNITYRLGYFIRRTNILNYSSLYNYWEQTGYSDYLNRWQNPGDEKSTNVPSMLYPGNFQRDAFYAASEINVERGDNIRFQDININYTTNLANWKKNPFKSVNFYLYLNNVGIIWKANRAGLDPDYGIPPPFSFSLGAKMIL
ncbi:MAG: SusC/RagA family TonB-linked outer membrane protein [Chitinophagaceae bacterium]|nr:SusC/RagA family TonB-linked outer membrane protein [Chitinophagaceae bacterium]